MNRDWRSEFTGRVVLTGGVASGKSTVLGVLRDRGVSVSSADDIVRRIWEEEGTSMRVADAIGWSIPIDMESLREAVFVDDQLRRRLNTFFHRSVLGELSDSGSLVCEIPLAFESGVFGYFSRIVTVVCDRSDQISRLISRGLSIADSERVLSTQLGGDLRCVASDWVLRTSCPLASVYEAASGLASKILEPGNLGQR